MDIVVAQYITFIVCDHYLQSTVQSHLVAIQPQFKTNLLESVEVYKHDLTSFSSSYSEVSLGY